VLRVARDAGHDDTGRRPAAQRHRKIRACEVAVDQKHFRARRAGQELRQLQRERDPQLTPRERECLNWTARGKSTWEISHILSCSEAAVNFHVKNIRAKFGVNSRRAAAVIAAQLGLIDPG